MQQFIGKVCNFIDLNTDNAHSNNTLIHFGGESIQEYVNMSLITTCFAHSRHVSPTFDVQQLCS